MKPNQHRLIYKYYKKIKIIKECDICIPDKNIYNEYDVMSYPIKVKKEAVKIECKSFYIIK